MRIDRNGGRSAGNDWIEKMAVSAIVGFVHGTVGRLAIAKKWISVYN